MAQKDWSWYHLQFIVIWVTKMGLAWQSSVTTLKEENAWKVLTITYGTFITPEQVCLSWQVSLKSPQTVNSLSSMSVIILSWHTQAGGYHVTPLRWITGAEHHLAVVSAHAEWPTHAQTPGFLVTVTKMTMCGVKTVVFSRIRIIYWLDKWGLVIQPVLPRNDITHFEN